MKMAAHKTQEEAATATETAAAASDESETRDTNEKQADILASRVSLSGKYPRPAGLQCLPLDLLNEFCFSS